MKNQNNSWIVSVIIVFFMIFLFITPVLAAYEGNNGAIVTTNENLVDNGAEQSLPPDIQNDIAEKIAAQEKVEKAIAEREKKLSEHLLKIDDSRDITREMKEFTLQNDASTAERGNVVPEGGFIQFSSEGKTRVFSSDGKQLYYATDANAEQIRIPSGAEMPVTHLIPVPSGSSIHQMGNKDHVIYKGKVICTVIDQGNDNNINHNVFTPSPKGNSWVEFAETDTYSPIGQFQAFWKIPNSPLLTPIAQANILFNGLQPNDGSLILQPVTGFNFDTHNKIDPNVNAENQWTGSAWICSTDNGFCFGSKPIVRFSEGEVAEGDVIWSKSLKEYVITLKNKNTNTQTQNSTRLFLRVPPQNYRAVVVYEAHPSYPIQFEDELKVGTTTFYGMSAKDANSKPISLNWNKNILYESHPLINGLYVDTSQAPSTVTLRTDYTYTITPTAGEHGTISPNIPIKVLAKSNQTFTITPESGYVVDWIIVDGNPVIPQNPYTFPQVTANHTIFVTFISDTQPIQPLVQAGTPFDSSKYPQNWPESDPMTFQCNWSGNGQVYISGNASSLNGVWADDGFTITIQPSGATFNAFPHYACQHDIIELTSGMRPGLNTFTLIVRNWGSYSMSYGSSTGYGTDQIPYIIQVNSPMGITAANQLSTEKMPSFIIRNETGLVVNGTVMVESK
ncbi:MAG: hypothetical protein Q7U51_09650 [Methanoregula sp.]|nr:hypothetical protein [Methanoregula sp.]